LVNKNPPAGAVMFTGTTSGYPYGQIFIATGKIFYSFVSMCEEAVSRHFSNSILRAKKHAIQK